MKELLKEEFSVKLSCVVEHQIAMVEVTGTDAEVRRCAGCDLSSPMVCRFKHA